MVSATGELIQSDGQRMAVSRPPNALDPVRARTRLPPHNRLRHGPRRPAAFGFNIGGAVKQRRWQSSFNLTWKLDGSRGAAGSQADAVRRRLASTNRCGNVFMQTTPSNRGAGVA
jgi:hypothetical protein